MTRLLCATDLLPKSEYAIDRGGILAQQMDADLSLLHVVSPTASPQILEQSLQIAIARMKSRVRPPLWHRVPTPSVRVRTGNPARLILATMADEEPDLLLLGPHRKRGVVDALEGTIAQKVLNVCKCPLLMVQRAADVGYQNVLLALDLSVESSGVVRAAESVLRGAGTRATVVHACEPPYDGWLRPAGAGLAEIASHARSARRATSAAVRGLLGRASTDAARYEIVLAEGRPIPVIQRAIKVHRPDLLVVGSRGNGPVRRALLGSVANDLFRTVGCDVLIVPRASVEAAKRTDTKPTFETKREFGAVAAGR
jgi:nucleotide-binding universal stress UspA family protein